MTNMVIERIDLGVIEVGDRMRGLDQGRVDALAASIKAIGLQTPITVVVVDLDGGETTYRLVAGLHRLEAVKALRWNQIDAFITTANELDCELWQIDENLIRADLTELERSQHLKRRKEIFDAKASGENCPTSKGGTDSTGKGHKGFDQDTADKTGLDKSTVRRSRNRAEKIDPQVQASIAGTQIANKGVELDALADMAPDDQKQAVEMVKSGSAASIRDAGKTIAPQKKKRRGRNAAQERAYFWRNLKEALENINGMPDVTTITNTVPAAQREMVTKRLPIVMDWLGDFRAEWAVKQAGTGDQDDATIELRGIIRAWDRISDDARREFVANLKEGDWL